MDLVVDPCVQCTMHCCSLDSTNKLGTAMHSLVEIQGSSQELDHDHFFIVSHLFRVGTTLVVEWRATRSLASAVNHWCVHLGMSTTSTASFACRDRFILVVVTIHGRTTRIVRRRWQRVGRKGDSLGSVAFTGRRVAAAGRRRHGLVIIVALSLEDLSKVMLIQFFFLLIVKLDEPKGIGRGWTSFSEVVS